MIFDTPTTVLIGLCLVLALLPPKWDPAIRIKKWQIKRGRHPETPSCFGSNPGPQDRALNDCFACPCAEHCLGYRP